MPDPTSPLQARREQLGLSRGDFADALTAKDAHVDEGTIRRWESGRTTPRPRNQKAICEVLETTPADLGWRPRPKPAPTIPTEQSPAPPHEESDDVNRRLNRRLNRRETVQQIAAGAALVGTGGLDTVLEIFQRIDAGKVSTADPSVVVLLGDLAAGAISDYETQHSAALAPAVAAQRRWVEHFRNGAQPLRKQIEAAACQLSGVLSTIARDLGQHSKAVAYGIEARVLADEVGDPHLRAWARAQQATAAHEAGHYQEAAELADDGLQVAPRAPHQARLLLRRAWALAEMGGRVRDVRSAVARGLDAAQDTGVRSHIALGPYCPAMATSFAAFAMAAADEAEAAQGHAEQALEIFDQEGTQVPAIRIDMASILASRDPARAAHLVTTATEAIGRHHPQRRPWGISVSRLKEFVTKTRSLDAAEIREARQQALEVLAPLRA
jgi:transcriptional regulator with XRE-family HTH domain